MFVAPWGMRTHPLLLTLTIVKLHFVSVYVCDILLHTMSACEPDGKPFYVKWASYEVNHAHKLMVHMIQVVKGTWLGWSNAVARSSLRYITDCWCDACGLNIICLPAILVWTRSLCHWHGVPGHSFGVNHGMCYLVICVLLASSLNSLLCQVTNLNLG